MSCFDIYLQQGSSFKRVPLVKEIIDFMIKSLLFKKKKNYLEGALSDLRQFLTAESLLKLM